MLHSLVLVLLFSLMVSSVQGYKKSSKIHRYIFDEDEDNIGDSSKWQDRLNLDYDKQVAERQIARVKALQKGQKIPDKLEARRHTKRQVLGEHDDDDSSSSSDDDDSSSSSDDDDSSSGSSTGKTERREFTHEYTSSSSRRTAARKELSARKWHAANVALAKLRGKVAAPYRFEGDERDNRIGGEFDNLRNLQEELGRSWGDQGTKKTGNMKRSVEGDDDDDSDSDSDNSLRPVLVDEHENADDNAEIQYLYPDDNASLNRKVLAAELQARLGLNNDVQAGYFSSKPQSNADLKKAIVSQQQKVIDEAFQDALTPENGVNLPTFEAEGDVVRDPIKKDKENNDDDDDDSESDEHYDNWNTFYDKLRLAYLRGRARLTNAIHVDVGEKAANDALTKLLSQAYAAGHASRANKVFVSEELTQFENKAYIYFA